ncbi:MAG: hypothetical protein QXR96_03415 [Candidatus Woesearchaeota archaeon]
MLGIEKISFEKKNFLIIIFIIFLLFGVLSFFLLIKNKENQSNWIEKNKINLERATEKRSYQNYIGQQSYELDTVFFHEGIYLGKYFKDYYSENNQIKLRFSELLKKDNIPDAYIFEKKELIENEKKLIVYIFLDEDWKNQISETNIIWGNNYQNIKKFSFSEKNKVSENIYIEKIEDDKERFSSDYKIHYSGIYVGKITKEQVEKNDFKDSIFIKFI